MTYTHGHHESVLRSHTWRTAENSAGYLLPHLHPGLSLLDIGCGPGTITVDLAARVAPGQVVGVDASSEVIAQAEAHAAQRDAANVRFEVGDIFSLDYRDATFAVVHAHQVLQHLGDPQAALVELRRVLEPGGLLAARDSDYSAFVWAPADPALDRWIQIYLAVTARNGHNARIGPSLLGLAQAAGFEDIVVSSTAWTFADPESRQWWGGLWADRVRFSRFAEQAVEYGLSDAAELESIAQAFLNWVASPDGVFVVPHVEILARR
jgi:ubiquinone/menaquinone biosynthesis C-methylase UbiE